MSKRKTIIIIAVTLMTSFVLAFIVGKSFSKNNNEKQDTIVAEIANWNSKVNDKYEKNQEIKLSALPEKNIKDNKIAPGTEGTIKIIIDVNNSDTDLQYTINFKDEVNKPTNLKFEYDNVEYENISHLSNILNGTIKSNDEKKCVEIEIKWIWKYETGGTPEEIYENDKIDTQDAMNYREYSCIANIIIEEQK